MTIIITILATIYTTFVIVLFGGRWISMYKFADPSGMSPLCDYLFIIFWPITIPIYTIITRWRG